MNRKRFLIIIVTIIIIGIAIVTIMNREHATSEVYYNKNLTISMNATIKIMAMPLIEDMTELVNLRNSMEELEEEMNMVKKSIYTDEAEELLNNLFDNAYTAMELHEKKLNGDANISRDDIWNKVSEVEDGLREYAKVMDEKEISLANETIEVIANKFVELLK